MTGFRLIAFTARTLATLRATTRPVVFDLKCRQLDVALEQLFKIGNQTRIRLGHQRHRNARSPGAASTADTVHVVFGVERHVEVEDDRQVGDVKAARGNIGRHQHIHFAALEGFERLQALVLRLVAMQGRSAQTIAFKRTRQPGRTELGIHEDQRLRDAALTQHLAHHGALVVIGDAVENLLDIGGRGIRTRHFNQHRLLQITLRQALDFGRESGRKQQGLARFRQVAEDALQIGQEADVEHAVSFVEHHIFNLVQHAILGFNMVKQTARRGDQDFNAALQHGRLRLHVDTAENASHAQLRVLGISLDIVGHLVGQFARWRQHQGTHWMAGRRCAGVFMLEHPLQQRDRERRGLAGAGLCRAHHVAAFQNDRNRLGLDRRHHGVAGVGNGT